MNRNLFDVKDRVIVITGGMGQLGRQFTSSLCEAGAKVAIFDIHIENTIFQESFQTYFSKGMVLPVVVDITNRESIETGLRKVIKQWGVPFGLVNNAAIDSPPKTSLTENGPFEQYPESSFERIMEVNVKGVVLCCQIIGGEMATNNRGSIINISSIYGIVSPDQRVYEYRKNKETPFFKPVSYSVSKSALLNLTRYLATYWADNNVRVNTLTFGGVYNNQDEEFLKEYYVRVPLGRMAYEDEYNGAIQFLLSDASSYMTGSNLVIDGGWTAW
ncbi:MAG: SDR family oxidoreductase [Methanospirillaceae archaeon]|nr:SDR family oxidoreductase [Methanospirillaceae archaeon]